MGQQLFRSWSGTLGGEGRGLVLLACANQATPPLCALLQDLRAHDSHNAWFNLLHRRQVRCVKGKRVWRKSGKHDSWGKRKLHLAEMVRNGIRAAARMFKWPPPFIDSSSSTSHQEGGMGKRGVQLRTAWRTRYALEYTSVYIYR
jgi:hypothetical protein